MTMTTMRLACFILAFFPVSLNAASYPALYCENENAEHNECMAESSAARGAVDVFFEPYMAHITNSGNRRRMLDCRRFCENEETYFTLHLPCHCSGRRQLAQEGTQSGLRGRRTQAAVSVDGPIQLLEAHVATMPSGRCKTVLEESVCVVTFVDHYEHIFEVADDTASTESYFKHGTGLDGLTIIEEESYEPELGDDASSGADGLTVIEEESYEPHLSVDASKVDGGITVIEDSSEHSKNEDVYNPEGSNSNGEEDFKIIDEEELNPDTGELVSVTNPNREDDFKIVDEHVFDPDTGELISNETNDFKIVDEEILDPTTGELISVGQGD